MKRALVWLVTAIRFAAFYIKEVIVCNIRVACDVLWHANQLETGVISFPVNNMTERQRLILATLLTMTPGTLSLELDHRRRLLYIHTLYLNPSAEKLRDSIRRNYEHPIRILF